MLNVLVARIEDVATSRELRRSDIVVVDCVRIQLLYHWTPSTLMGSQGVVLICRRSSTSNAPPRNIEGSGTSRTTTTLLD